MAEDAGSEVGLDAAAEDAGSEVGLDVAAEGAGPEVGLDVAAERWSVGAGRAEGAAPTNGGEPADAAGLAGVQAASGMASSAASGARRLVRAGRALAGWAPGRENCCRVRWSVTIRLL